MGSPGFLRLLQSNVIDEWRREDASFCERLVAARENQIARHGKDLWNSRAYCRRLRDSKRKCLLFLSLDGPGFVPPRQAAFGITRALFAPLLSRAKKNERERDPETTRTRKPLSPILVERISIVFSVLRALFFSRHPAQTPRRR